MAQTQTVTRIRQCSALPQTVNMSEGKESERAMSKLPPKFRKEWRLLDACEELGKKIDMERGIECKAATKEKDFQVTPINYSARDTAVAGPSNESKRKNSNSFNTSDFLKLVKLAFSPAYGRLKI